MNQIALLEVQAPETPDGIDLHCCGVEEMADRVSRPPALIVADPPWHYSQAPGHSANPENHYSSMTDDEIAWLLAASWHYAAPASRLAVWCTWPKLGQWQAAIDRQAGNWRWRYVSGGAWTKMGGSPGTGYHWIGQSEICLLYVKGTGLCTEWGPLTNAHTSRRQAHSEKPADWMAQWIERWTRPDDLVCDLFAGLAPLARSCILTGRDYVGAEIDPDRHRQAVDRIALYRPDRA